MVFGNVSRNVLEGFTSTRADRAGFYTSETACALHPTLGWAAAEPAGVRARHGSLRIHGYQLVVASVVLSHLSATLSAGSGSIARLALEEEYKVIS